MSNSANVNSVDEVLPAPQLLVMGLQHVLMMYAAALAVPLIIGGALKLPKDQIAFLISADLFCCGLVTMIQCIGIWKIGIKFPIMMAVGFSGIAPIIAIGSQADLGMQGIFGAVIGSGIFTLVVAPYMSRMVRWFPPIVTGTVVLVIGVSLMRVGINWAAGGQPTVFSPSGPIPNPNYGLPDHLAIAGVVLLSILLITAFFKGFISHLAVLIGITLGFLIALFLGKVNFAGVATAAWFNIVTPFHFGLPKFDFISIVTLSIIMVVMMIESTGQFLALADITGKKISRDDLARGLRADGVGNIIGGIFGTFTYTSCAQNVGLVQITNVHSRWVCVTAGAILLAFGCLPKLAFFFASIPEYVIGGAALVMFGMVSAAGVKILTRVDFVNNGKNLYIVAISLAVALIPVVSTQFFSQLPPGAAKFLNHGILLGTISAVFLNILFNFNVQEDEESFTFADGTIREH